MILTVMRDAVGWILHYPERLYLLLGPAVTASRVSGRVGVRRNIEPQRAVQFSHFHAGHRYPRYIQVVSELLQIVRPSLLRAVGLTLQYPEPLQVVRTMLLRAVGLTLRYSEPLHLHHGPVVAVSH